MSIPSLNSDTFTVAGRSFNSRLLVGTGKYQDHAQTQAASAAARDPVLMASAMRKAIQAGRETFLAGSRPAKRFASTSSPVEGLFF
jgi:thiazole synthase ThiGH ThiG subunit